MSYDGDRPKLSLLAQFDDLIRYNTQLFMGIEDEFIIFVENQMGCLKKWNNAVKAADSARYGISQAKRDKDLAETKLKHMKSLLETEIQKRLKVENEKKVLERQIAIIKEVLLADQSSLNDQTRQKLAFLNANLYNMRPTAESVTHRLDTIEESMGSILSASDVSFDKTDDDLDNDPEPSYSRQTRSKRATTYRSTSSPKKQKVEFCPDVNTNSTDSENGGDPEIAKYATVTRRAASSTDSENGMDQLFAKYATVTRRTKNSDLENGVDQEFCRYATVTHRTRKSKRYSDETEPKVIDTATPTPIHKSDSEQFTDLLSDGQVANDAYIRPSPQRTPLRRLSSAAKMNRAHIFFTKTLIRSEMCLFCNQRIRFYKQALKCQECRATCHPECKEKVPLPCFPSVQTPTSKEGMGTIADYTPSTSPMIPALIVHCVNEIEKRGLSEIGLYRISGSEREVKDLKEKFLKGKCVPLLSNIDIHAVCGTMKDFLRTLKEPLITRVLWKDFVHASEMPNIKDGLAALDKLIRRLPQPNRDTLSFLILHLSNVADSSQCMMPIENLAKVFGPTIVGYSISDPPASTMMYDTKCQYAVMFLMLKAPEELWQKYSSLDCGTYTIATPEPRQAPEGNLLGPIHSGGGDNGRTLISNHREVTKTYLTPRNTKYGTVKAKRQFFSSPLLK